MKIAKNAFSYVLWLFYAMLVGSGLFCVVTVLGQQAGSNLVFTLCIGAGILLVSGSLSILFKKLLSLCLKHDKEINKTLFVVFYFLIFALLLGVGFYLREEQLVLVDQSDPFHYLDMAFVKSGSHIPVITHGIEALYVHILRLVCFVFGNYDFMCLQVQVMVSLAGGAIFCEAVRRLTGYIPALMTFAFFNLSPYWIVKSCTLDAGALLLILYAVTLLALALWYQSKERGVWYFMAVGALVGVVCFLDIVGVTLVIAMVYAFLSELKNDRNSTGDVVYLGLLGVSGLILAVAVCFGLRAVSTKTGIAVLVSDLINQYSPKTFAVGIQSLLQSETLIVLILLAVASVGVFGFWLCKGKEAINIWILMIGMMVAGDCFGIFTANVNGMEFLYLFVSVLAGVGCMNLYDGAMETALSGAQAQKEAEEQKKEQENLTPGYTKPDQNGIQYLENPLPLPKKHEKRNMDYDYFVADDDDFDIE